MILAKLNPSEEHLLEFTLNIQGTVEPVTEVRFVIENGGYNLSFPCTNENGKVTVKVPKLNESVSSGIHNSKLECIIGDKIFTPMTETVEILENIKVKVSEEVTLKNTQVTVNIVQEEDFTVAEEHGYKVIKKGNQYFGIIGEEKTLRTTNGHASLEGLVEYFTSQE